MRTASTAAALVAAITLGACGETTIDAGKGEQAVERTIRGQIGARVTSVTCPEGLKAQRGKSFTCAVVGADGTKGKVRVRQKDDEGNVEIEAPFLHVRQAESVLAEEISKELDAEDVELSCPEIIVVRASETFDCEAAAGEKTREVAVRMTDDEGNFRYRLR